MRQKGSTWDRLHKALNIRLGAFWVDNGEPSKIFEQEGGSASEG